MRNFRYIWLIGLAVTLAVIIIPLAIFWPQAEASVDDPRAFLPKHKPHTPHTNIIQGPFNTPQEVTRACLNCHPEAAKEVMQTVHWTWESKPVKVPGHDNVVMGIGKKNLINNFCIGIQGNWNKCTSCHAGYGWADNSFDFNNPENVDCLACHADPGTYAKGNYGLPAESVDLVAAARSVRNPTRENCGACHFDGGGGNGVKHGDLDESLYFPSENLDIHMGREDFQCTDCHRTEKHQIRGRMISVSVEGSNQVQCTDCHSERLHADERINTHVKTVACQTCHVPAFALKNPTKTFWDWSTAGQDRPDDHYTYLKIKGSFIYEKNVLPTYLWFNESVSYRYLLGDKIDPTKPTLLNPPAGDINDPTAKIFPFKIHVARQPYDKVYNYLLQPLTAGEGGFWTTFDWESALRKGAEFTGLPFSGEYDFAETWMYWPITHMVQS
ncbi:MAG: tetrathionate reductase family octaheme c-type cytochrome, partial [Anaerolineales bacterium]|nr:tetrathionate reductase family octaheme c-type cytochrome [Anaerolineales bacterium]